MYPVEVVLVCCILVDTFLFLRGDVFTVYNEMGDGWLWVKSLRTKESGIIFSALVEDMTKNADPNEGKGRVFRKSAVKAFDMNLKWKL